MKRIVSLLLVLSLIAAAFSVTSCGEKKEETQTEKEGKATGAKVKNPETFVYASPGDPDSLDPSKAYDSSSWTVMTNIYESLIEFKGTSTDEFEAVLAEEIPSTENGGIINGGKTYRFKIREGVKFHNGEPLEPEDVEYTFERNMVVDAAGGPNWIWYTYLVGGMGGSKDGDGNFQITYDQIDKTVEVEGQYVIFNLPKAFPPFLSVIANTWGGIVNKDFVIENGGWDGTADTWKNYNKPEEQQETLYEVACGTGPYELGRWEKGTEVVLNRFEDYWGEKPAMKKGIVKNVSEWSTRKLMLLQGDVDCAYVPPQHYDATEQESGIKVNKDLPTLNVTGIHFNYDINTQDNPLTGSGQLGDGIPSNFFNDINVRKGFAYAWNEEVFLKEVWKGRAIDPVTPVPKGLPFKDSSVEAIPHDMDKAEEHFKKAFGGDVWEKGFQLEILYNEGNDVRSTIAKMLAENIEKLNDNFNIETRAVTWADYLDKIRNKTMPLFVIGWAPDYPDPDNFVTPFMHSTKGTFAAWASYENKRVDELIEKAGIELASDKREEMYYELQEIYIEDVISVMTHQETEWRFYRDWVQGNYFNPMQSHEFDLLPEIEKK